MRQIRLFSFFGFVSLAIISISCVQNAEAAKQKKVIDGTISGYRCGDNCYLTIVDKNGKEHTGLCVASPLCDKWNEEVMMPNSFKGKKVRVSIGKGIQLDGDGNEIGTMDAFTTIQLSK